MSRSFSKCCSHILQPTGGVLLLTVNTFRSYHFYIVLYSYFCAWHQSHTAVLIISAFLILSELLACGIVMTVVRCRFWDEESLTQISLRSCVSFVYIRVFNQPLKQKRCKTCEVHWALMIICIWSCFIINLYIFY